MTNGLILKGTIFSLYVGTTFIEHFATLEAALAYAHSNYKGLDFFVKPVVFFDVERNQNESRSK